MAKLHLPKEIREDPKLREIFGEPEPQKVEIQEESGNSHLILVSYGWKKIRETWLKKRQPRKCVRCGKQYLPNQAVQKYCDECRKPKGFRNSHKSCPDCGRITLGYDKLGRCSFCMARIRKFNKELRETERKRALRKKASLDLKCLRCACEITESERDLFDNLCSRCYYEIAKAKV
jgi:hypothetical protein